MKFKAQGIPPLITLLTITAFCASRAEAQDLKPVEQTIEDIGPLGQSHRILPEDLRLPTGFERVYRVPGSADQFRFNANQGHTDDMLMRINGALRAVFPRSVYIPTRRGLKTDVPPGTVFHIGQPLAENGLRTNNNYQHLSPLGAETLLMPTGLSSKPVHRRIDTSRSEAQDSVGNEPQRQQQRAQSRVSIWTSETYRRHRVENLIKQVKTHQSEKQNQSAAG